MYTFTDEIEAELAKGAVRFIELFRVDLGTVNGTSYVYYWSDKDIPAGVTFDGQAYEARVTRRSLEKLPRGKDGKATLEISNHDGLITDLLSAGVWLEHGRVSVVRQFILSGTDADVLNVGDWTNPYWHGRITELKELNDATATVSVEFGYLDLTRRFGRTIAPMCSCTFADDFYCPYDPATGYGRPNPVTASGTATSATSTTIVETGKDFSLVEVGDIVVSSNGTTGTSGTVTGVATGQLTLAAGWSHGTPAAGWHYEVGPAATTCGYTWADCEDRGMAGPTDNVADNLLNWSRRRYFQGFVPSAETNVRVGERKWFGLKHKEYSTIPSTNGGIIGEPIPIPVGTTKLALKPAAYLVASPFTHFIFYLGEGRMGTIDVSSIRIDGEPLDNIGNTTQGATDDSLILGGFDGSFISDADDADAVTNSELTEAQRQSGVGILKSRAWQYAGGTTISTYKSNPRLFSSANGSGISPMGCAWMRVRVEKTFDNPADVTCEVVVTEGSMMLKADGTTWTGKPDVAEVALNACINRSWGAGLSIEQINLTALDDFSDWCRTLIDYTQSDRPGNSLSTTVGFGPYDCLTEDTSTNWVFVELAEPASTFNHWYATINGETHEITSVRPYSSVPKKIRMPSGYDLEVPDQYRSLKGAMFFFASNWTTVPADGDSVTIAQAAGEGFTGYSVRGMANGVLNLQEKNFDEALTEILRCANAEWFQDLGKIYFTPRKQVDTETLTTPTITDKGASRNVISGSVKFSMDSPGKAPNSVSVKFVDRQDAYRPTTILIKDTEAQLERKRRFNEQIKDESKSALYLPLVDTYDHAARVGSQIARQKGIRSDGKRNATITVEMPAHLAMKLQPILDVCPLDLNGVPDWVEFGRVESIEEGRLGLVSEVTFSVYNHDDHSDDPYDFHRDRVPGEIVDGDGNPVQFEIVSMAEALIEGQDGSYQSAVDIEVTLPGSEKALRAVLFWKYDTEHIRQAREASAHVCDYLNDSNAVLDGVQNQARLIGIPYDRSSETVNIFVVPEYADRSREMITWRSTAAAAVMDDSGGIDGDDQTVDVLKPSGGTFAQGDLVLIGSERCRITSISSDTPDVSHDRWTILRGLHGTTAVAHANGTTFEKFLCSVEMEPLTLAGVTTGLSAPSDLVALPYAYSIRLGWTNNIAAADMAQLDSFVLFWSLSSMSSFDPNDSGAWPVGATAVRVGTGDSFVFFPLDSGVPDATNPYYFRLCALNRAGVYSAVTDEANATALTESTDDDDTPDPADEIVIDVDMFSNVVGGLAILVGVQATVNADSANGVQVKIRNYEGPSTNFAADQDDPFTGSVWESTTYEQAHPAVVSVTGLAFDKRYEVSARVRNAFGWSNWTTPVEFEWDTSTNLDVNVVPTDVPTLDAFYAWTADDPPAGGDANLGSGMVRFGYRAGANSATSFELDVEGYTGTAPSETPSLDQASATATVQRGTLTVTVAGSTATLNQYQGDWFRIGREGAANSLTQCLEEMRIASNTAGDPFTITLVDHGWKIKSNGQLDYWSILPELSREIADYHHHFKIDDPVGPSGTYKVAKPEDFLVVLAEAAEMKFRARLHNIWGRGTWVYADATSTGTGTAGSAVAKTVGKVQASMQSQDAIPAGHNIVFTAVSATEVSWAHGHVYFADGTDEGVSASSASGLTGGETYWLYLVLGSGALSITSSVSTAIGSGNVVVAMVVASSDATEKATIISRWGKGTTITAQAIACEKLSAITAVLGIVEAGEIKASSYLSLQKGADLYLISDVARADASRIVFGSSSDGTPANFVPAAHLFAWDNGSYKGIQCEPETTQDSFFGVGSASKLFLSANMTAVSASVTGSLGTANRFGTCEATAGAGTEFKGRVLAIWDLSNYGSWEARATSSGATLAANLNGSDLLTLTSSKLSTSKQIESTLGIGTAPITVTSTTVCPNLNASLLEGNAAAAFATAAHNHTLDGLSNVTITSNSSGEILKWNGSAWINNTLAEAGIAAASHNHDAAYVNASGDAMTGNLSVSGISAGTRITLALSLYEAYLGIDSGGNLTLENNAVSGGKVVTDLQLEITKTDSPHISLVYDSTHTSTFYTNSSGSLVITPSSHSLVLAYSAGVYCGFQVASNGALTVTPWDGGGSSSVSILGTETITSTSSPQLTVAYDGTYKTTFATSSGGDLTIAPSGGDLLLTGSATLTRTTTQLKLAYSDTEYCTFTVGSSGSVAVKLDTGTYFDVVNASGNNIGSFYSAASGEEAEVLLLGNSTFRGGLILARKTVGTDKPGVLALTPADTDAPLYAWCSNDNDFMVYTTIPASGTADGYALGPNMLQLKDYVSEPSTSSGKASIFIASGNALKVKFGDGTVKTVTLT